MKLITRSVFAGIIAAAVCAAIAYWQYGKIMGEYVDLDIIFSTSQNFIENAARDVSGINEMRAKILGAGLIGGAVGTLGYLFRAVVRRR